MMKKLSLYVFLLLMFCTVGFADVTEVYCLIRKADLFRAKISPEDHSRFAGKEIVFAISFEEKLIADVSEDGEVSVITGMYGPKDTQEFEKIIKGSYRAFARLITFYFKIYRTFFFCIL